MEQNVLKYAVGYVRCAATDPTGEAVRRQEKLIQQYCEENNLMLLNIFKDNGASGLHFNRPGWIALMSFINQNNKIVKSIVAADLARIVREGHLFFSEKENLKKNYGITIQTADYSHNWLAEDLIKNRIQRPHKKRNRKTPRK